jgi:hypothetical protein
MHPIAKELSCPYERHEGPYVTGRVAWLLVVEVNVSPQLFQMAYEMKAPFLKLFFRSRDRTGGHPAEVLGGSKA